MTPPDKAPSQVGVAGASLNRLRWWARHTLGGWGLAALAAAGVVAWLQLHTLPQIRAALLAERAQLAQQQRARGRAMGSAVEVRTSARALLDSLPERSQRGELVGRLLRGLGAGGATLERADYAQQDDAAGVSRLTVSVPLTGDYDAVRRSVANVLTELPNAALDSLQIDRPDTRAQQLLATAQFTLFFRATPP